MRSLERIGLFTRVLVVALVVALSVPVVPAFAVLEQEMSSGSLKSSTNPGDPDDREVSWRWLWGNSLYPHLNMSSIPSDPDVVTDGLFYEFNQSRYTTPTPGGPHLTPIASTSFESVFDIDGLMIENGWTQQPGAVKPGEGVWWLHWRFYNQFRVEDNTRDAFFGIDLTPPTSVQGLVSGVTKTSVNSGWTEATRRVLRWNTSESSQTAPIYDALSGVGGYSISINDSDTVFVPNVAPKPEIEWWATELNPLGTFLPQVHTVTIEDLPAGANKLSVVTVDRATNRSPARVVYANVDPDSPKVSITYPASGAIVGLTPTFKVAASDAAGISRVRYFVDDILVGTSTGGTFAITANLSGFGNGAHTLRVVAEDMIGSAAGPWLVPHTVSATRSFTLDKSAPVLTLTSAGPSPFYPRKRDGYKDNYVIKFRSSEAVTAKLVIKDSTGRTWRTISRAVPAGYSSVAWDGKSSTGSMKAGTFRWTLRLYDKAGNYSSAKYGSATIRFYDVVKTGTNTVRIIAR